MRGTETNMSKLIDLYYWPTPNGWKASIFLEELGLPYEVRPINIAAGDQFEPEFLKISPNNKMPAIVDQEGPDGEPISVFESGAILIYLAEKTGRFLPTDPRGRYRALEWLMFQTGSVGPMLGQAHHFRQYAPEIIPYAIERYTNEAARIYRVIDRRLAESEFIATDDYTTADVAIFSWLVPHEHQGQEPAGPPHPRLLARPPRGPGAGPRRLPDPRARGPDGGGPPGGAARPGNPRGAAPPA